MYAVPVYLAGPGEIDSQWIDLMQWASLALTVPVVVFSARSFFARAWRDLSNRQIGMDVPIALAIGAAFVASIRATVIGEGEVYFDSVTMFVFLLLGARYLEAESCARAVGAIERLSHSLPATALIARGFPLSRATVAVASAELMPGDVVLVESGTIVPADGRIAEGAGEISEAVVTGESLPLTKRTGDTVVGGSVNAGSPLFVQVSQVGANTVLAHIVRLTARALADKPSMVELVIVFSLGYLVVYPGLGNFAGSFNWTSANEYDAEIKQANADYGPLFDKYLKVDIPALAKDPQANAMGQRLFLNYCAQCHGSDAGGTAGFPNLRDKDWLYGGDPVAIETTILNGRNGVMPVLGPAIGGEAGVLALTQYVRSLSGLKHDSKKAEAGKAKFAVCGSCHGADGKGMTALGAPNLTDAVWLYGSAEETIAETIRLGRNNMMPAQKERLGEAKVHLLAAYVYSLGGGQPPVTAGAPPAAKP